MSDTNIVELTTQDELDQKVVSLRIAGVAPARIARELGLGSAKKVIEALERGLPQVDASYRARIMREELAKLDQLQTWWFAASKTSASAAAIVLKIAERRAAMLALDAPQHVRLDPVRLVADAEPHPNETAALLKELERIAAERPASGPRIEADIEAEAEAPGPPAA